MQVFRAHQQDRAGLVGWGVRVLLAAGDGAGLAQRIAGFGGLVDCETEVYSALSSIDDDPAGWSLLVVDCDCFGGLETCRRMTAMLGVTQERLSVVLIASDCGRQEFPEDRRAPIILRAPVSQVALRIGIEHALRDRIGWRGMS